jgi:hypothetical protein
MLEGMNTVWRSVVTVIFGIHDSATKAWSRMVMTFTSLIKKIAFFLLRSFDKYMWEEGSYGEEVLPFKAYWSRDASTGFSIQQLDSLSTLYLCVLCLPENKQRLLPLTA